MSYFELLYKKYNKLMITKTELANELGMSEPTLNRRLYSGELLIAYSRIGQKYTFSLKSVCEYLEAIDLLAA